MKRLVKCILGLLVVTSTVSCKKDYYCLCNSNYMGKTEPIGGIEIEDKSLSEAEQLCQEEKVRRENVPLPAKNITCEIQVK